MSTKFAKDVIKELNIFRSNPKSIQHQCELIQKGFSRLRANDPFLKEIESFVKELQTINPLPELKYNKVLSESAEKELPKFRGRENYQKYRKSIKGIVPDYFLVASPALIADDGADEPINVLTKTLLNKFDRYKEGRSIICDPKFTEVGIAHEVYEEENMVILIFATKNIEIAPEPEPDPIRTSRNEFLFNIHYHETKDIKKPKHEGKVHHKIRGRILEGDDLLGKTFYQEMFPKGNRSSRSIRNKSLRLNESKYSSNTVRGRVTTPAIEQIGNFGNFERTQKSTNYIGSQRPSINYSGYQKLTTNFNTGYQRATTSSGYKRSITSNYSGYQRPTTISTGNKRPSTIYTGYQRPSTISTGYQRPPINYTATNEKSEKTVMRRRNEGTTTKYESRYETKTSNFGSQKPNENRYYTKNVNSTRGKFRIKPIMNDETNSLNEKSTITRSNRFSRGDNGDIMIKSEETVITTNVEEKVVDDIENGNNRFGSEENDNNKVEEKVIIKVEKKVENSIDNNVNSTGSKGTSIRRKYARKKAF